MAKRFTDTDKWKDVWFCELTPSLRMAYLYILDNCDQVGVWEPNFRLANFQLNDDISWELLKSLLGDSRLYVMPNGNWWMRKFCDFQYGKLSEDNKSQTTKYYIKLLIKHSLWIVYVEGIDTPKEKEKDKETDKDKEKDMRGKVHFSHMKEFYSRPYESHMSEFKEMYTKKEYEDFRAFLNNMLKDFGDDLAKQFDRCLSIGDWKNYLQGKGYLIIKPYIVAVLGAKEGNRMNMGARLANFAKEVLTTSVYVRNK